MVGRRIDGILARKANAKNGNSYFSPIVVPVVSSFKRIYKTRLSKNGVFKGKPLHTIDESTESIQNELISQNLNTFNDEELGYSWHDMHTIHTQEGGEDTTLVGIRYLFEISEDQGVELENKTLIKNAHNACGGSFGLSESGKCPSLLDSSVSPASPSISLMQQFEWEAKVEAACMIQRWYRQIRERRKYLQIKQAAIVIQRLYRKNLR